MGAETRVIYEIHHHYSDGSSRKTMVRLGDDATMISVEPEDDDWLWLHSQAEAESVANAILALAPLMEED